MSSFGSLILPLAYAPAPWLYAHDVRIHQIPGSADYSSLNESNSTELEGVNGDIITVWDVGWPQDVKGGKALAEEFSWQQKSAAYRSLVCSTADKYRVVAALLGGYGTAPGSGSSGFNFVKQGLFTGPPAWGEWSVTKYAQVDITFRSLDWIPGDVGSLALEFSSDIIAPPDGSFSWSPSGSGTASGPIASDQAPGIPVKTISFVRVLKNQATIPISQIYAAMETVNSVEFYGIPAGFVLFETCDTFTRAAGYNPSGSGYTWDISYRFKARKIAPWNAFMNPQGTWQPVVSTQSGQPYWPSYDYNGLFPSTSNQPIS